MLCSYQLSGSVILCFGLHLLATVIIALLLLTYIKTFELICRLEFNIFFNCWKRISRWWVFQWNSICTLPKSSASAAALSSLNPLGRIQIILLMLTTCSTEDTMSYACSVSCERANLHTSTQLHPYVWLFGLSTLSCILLHERCYINKVYYYYYYYYYYWSLGQGSCQGLIVFVITALF